MASPTVVRDVEGRVALVTGATSGIGQAPAVTRALFDLGDHRSAAGGVTGTNIAVDGGRPGAQHFNGPTTS